jgi:hypothetical protein
MATVETREPQQRGGASRPAQRRIRVSIRKVNPWSVLKLSLLFYFCLMLVIIFGLGILYMLLEAIGVLDSLAELLGTLGFGGGAFEFQTLPIFRSVFLIGIITVIVGSAFTMFLAFLYNLLSDLVGGVEVTLVERR